MNMEVTTINKRSGCLLEPKADGKLPSCRLPLKPVRLTTLRLLLFVTALLCFGPLSLSSQSFQKFINRLNSLPEAQRQAVADSFMVAASPIPFTESDTLVNFVYNAPASSVAMAGDATGWNPDKTFVHVSGCNFWYYSTVYESDARLDYKLVINGNNWILDPKNPYTCSGGFGPNSELRMPAYLKPPEIVYDPGIAHGTFFDTTFYSAQLSNSRKIRVYLPPGYTASGHDYPVVLFHDGMEYIDLCKTNNILDYLIAHQLIVPVIGIFVPPVDREAEYAGAKIDKFTAFITSELMPVIDTRFRTSRDSSKRAMIGASNGGNIALYIGMKTPGQFGLIGAQSSNVEPVISSTFSNGPKLNLRMYLDIGTYDIGLLIPLVRNFRTILDARGYDYLYHEWHEGHSWGNWMGHLRHPLMQFFPYTTGCDNTPRSPSIRLGPVYPNPFRTQATIPFSAPAGSDVTLTLSDLAGREIDAIRRTSLVQTENSATFENASLKPGTYIITMNVNGSKQHSIIAVRY